MNGGKRLATLAPEEDEIWDGMDGGNDIVIVDPRAPTRSPWQRGMLRSGLQIDVGEYIAPSSTYVCTCVRK